MKKILSQEEIDSMIRTARSGTPDPARTCTDRSRHLVGWPPGGPDRTGTHASSHPAAPDLRPQSDPFPGRVSAHRVRAELVSAEHLSYAEFLRSIPEVTYLASCKLMPAGASALAQLDLSAAYPLIDVLLGGEGKGQPPARAITEIEEQILETVMHIICRELQTAWQALALEFQFEQRQHLGQVEQLMPAAEKILLLSFEITVLESRGVLNLVVPAQVSNALLRKMAERTAARPRLRPLAEQRLRSRLLNCPFAVELTMLSLRVPLRSLMGLSPGTLLGLGRSAQHPATLLVAGQEMFTASVVRRGPLRAAQVLARQEKRDPADEIR